jgi:hypothetical protein
MFGRWDHFRSAVDSIPALGRAHIASGVVTERQLTDLSRYKVLVVGDLTRISRDEADAFREYVRSGGQLYASGRTSLLETDGTVHDDFMLADVFGAHYEATEQGEQIFLLPTTDEAVAAIAPQKHLGWSVDEALGPPRLAADPDGTVLAALTLPYAYPERGTASNQSWSSVYATPPWTEKNNPLIVETANGDGRTVYSALPLERSELDAGQALFISLVRRLLGDEASLTSEAHPCVWLEIFHQHDRARYLVNILNFPDDLRPIPTDVAFSLTVPNGVDVTRVVRALDGKPIAFETKGRSVEIKTHVEVYEAVTVEYRR